MDAEGETTRGGTILQTIGEKTKRLFKRGQTTRKNQKKKYIIQEKN